MPPSATFSALHITDSSRQLHLLAYPSGTVLFSDSWCSSGHFVRLYLPDFLPQLHRLDPSTSWRLEREIVQEPVLVALIGPRMDLLRSKQTGAMVAITHHAWSETEGETILKTLPRLAAVVSACGWRQAAPPPNCPASNAREVQP